MNYLEMKKKALHLIVGKVKGFVRSVTGTPPIALEACADNASIIDYKIHGNSFQDGTPSPDNPIEVQSVGELVTDETDANYGKYKIPIVARNKNLLDIKSTYLLHSNDKIKQTDTGFISNSGYYNSSVYDITGVLKPNTRYYFHRDLLKYDSDGNEYTILNNTTNVIAGYIFVLFDDGSYYYQYNNTNNVYYNSSGKNTLFSNTGEFTFITPSSFSNVVIKTYTGVPKNSGVIQDYDSTKKYYIEWKNVYLGTEPYSRYEPYQEPITTNIYLDEPLRKVGDYADYIDFKNGLLVNKTYTKNLSEVDFTLLNKELTNGFVRVGYFNVKPTMLKGIAIDGFCNILPTSSRDFNNPKEESIRFGQVNSMIYIYTKSAYASKEELLNYLGDAKVTYILRNSTETSISLPILPTFKGITTVYEVGTTIQPSNMEAEYYSTLKGE